MAETTNSGGSAGGGLYFIVGILVAAVAVLGFVVFHGHLGGGGATTKTVGVTISGPSTPGR